MNEKNRWQNAGIISKLLHAWIFPLLRLGNKLDLDQDDLYECHEEYKSEFLADKLNRRWQEELQIKSSAKKPSFTRAVLSTFKVELIQLVVVVFIQNCFFRIGQSLALREIIIYYAEPNPTSYDYQKFLTLLGVLWIMSFGYSFLANHGFSMGSFIGTKIRTACTQLLYKKIMKLGVEHTTDTASGQIVNLIANNMNRFEIAAKFCAYIVVAPLQLLITALLLWNLVGVGTLAGSAAFTIQFVGQFFIGRYITQIRRKTAKITDERVRTVNEIFSAIRVIKMYTWETPLFKYLKAVRHSEMSKKLFSSIFNGTASDFSHAFGKLGVFFSLIVHFLLLGHPFTAESLFVTTSMFENLRLAGRMFAFAVSYLADTLACLRRVQEIMLTEEKETKNYEHRDTGNNRDSISIARITSFWSKAQGTAIRQSNACLERVSFTIKKGELVAVVGPIGSGKTSLLMAIMGELVQEEGLIAVEGSIAYVPQEAWHINRSIRDNVLLFSTFTNPQYADALVATTLDKDIMNMEFKDNTPVGERGSHLSGGQRARVNLCRAVCSDADIYLMDDPLSAVDASVAKTIFNECICGTLKNKTRILVTHQVQFLKNVDKIIVLERGHLKGFGSYDEIQKAGINIGVLTEEAAKEVTTNPLEGCEPAPDIPNALLVSSETESNYKIIDILEDDDVEDHLPPKPVAELSRTSALKVFCKYFSAAGGSFAVFLILFLGISAQAFFSMIDMFLSLWSAGQKCIPQDGAPLNIRDQRCPAYAPLLTSQNMYFQTYVVMVGCLVTFWILRSSFFHFFCNRASKYLHRKAIRSLLFAPVSFFDANPMGRILNRITKDVGNVDDVLPFMFSEGYAICLMQVGYMVLIVYYLPPMAAGCFFLLLCCFLFGKFYIRPGRDLQRIEATTSSPVYSMMGMTLKGLALVRANKGEELFTKRFAFMQNIQTSAAVCNSCAGSFYRTGVEVFSMIFLVAVFITLILSPAANDQVSGITLTSSTQIGIAIQYISLLVLQVITLMVSVERVLDYKTIEPEPEAGNREPPQNWPQSGEITFRSVVMKYRPEDEEPALKNMTFHIPAGQKVGIAGRSGAGKSTIISALLRLHEPQGEVLIDGVKASDISLKTLRSRISVIPQEPILFTGTLRKSLDPFGRFPDFKMWEALRTVHMDVVIRDLPDGLSTHITDGGSNFSIGQKQLLCLARAILLKNRILLLDEASASLDYESDELIQTAIRHNFRDCTTLTVAHRLDTIMDCDQIMVMDHGELKEFGDPHLLLQNPDGWLTQLVSKTGPSKGEELKRTAKAAHIRRNGERTFFDNNSYVEGHRNLSSILNAKI